MPNDYCTVQEVKDGFPDLESFTSKQTTFLTRAVTAASRAIDKATKHYAGYWYVSADTTNYYDGYGTDSTQHWPYGKPNQDRPKPRVNGAYLRLDDIASITSISISENGSVSSYTALASTDWYADPYNAANEGKPYTGVYLDIINGNYAVWPSFPKSIKVVGKFGYSVTVPDLIKQVAIMQAGRFFARAKQAYQNSHTVLENENTISFTDKLDTDLEKMLKQQSRVAI